jgi:hypothetical protein
VLQMNAVAFCVLALMYAILLMPVVVAAGQADQAGASWGGFRSIWATRLAMLGALGFVGALGFIPGCARLFGFMGFFGFIGVAYMVEVIVRFRKRRTSPSR